MIGRKASIMSANEAEGAGGSRVGLEEPQIGLK